MDIRIIMNKRTIQLALLAFLAVVLGSVFTWIILGRPATGIDDADIFFVYARHLAEGHGFVYNIGGGRVEGFTSMLWTLVCTLFFKTTDAVEVPLYLLNLLLGTVTVWFCLKRIRKPSVFLMLLAAAPAWFVWCQVTLMESGLWCLLLTLSVLAAVEQRTVALALLIQLLLLTRPESMLWGAWLILMLGCRALQTGGWRGAFRAVAVPFLLYIVTLLALVGFRMSYFGYPVPNTYYAKVSPSLSMNLRTGSGYLLEYVLLNPAVLLAAVTWIWVVIQGLRNWRAGWDEPMWIALCLLPGIGIPVIVGGDHFGGSRFYQAIWPLLCLLTVHVLEPHLGLVGRRKLRAGLLTLVVCGWVLFPFTGRLEHEFRIARRGRDTGRALSIMFSDLDPLPSVAVITAGGNKYGYPGTVYDLMGLNATEMAHAPGPRTGFKNHTAFNREIFFKWHPDILLCGEDAEFDAKVLKGLPSDELFRSRYLKMTLQRNGHEVTAWYSHAFLEQVHQTRR